MTIPLPVLPNVYRVSLLWTDTAGGPPAVNVIHIAASTSGTGPGDAKGALDHAVNASMFYVQPTTFEVYQYNIIPLDGHSSTTSLAPAVISNWRGQTAGGYAPQVCNLIKLQTGLRGRSNRGRIYLPHVCDSANSNGQVGSSALTSIQTAWSSFLTGLTTYAPAFNLVVAAYDRDHGGASPHATTVTSVVAEQYTATQRRRQPGRKVARH